MQDDTASVCTMGAGRHARAADATAMEFEIEEGGNLENELVAADDLGEVMDIAPSQLTLRATKMFTEGSGAPHMSKEPCLASDPTLWLIKLAKEAVSELFAHRYEEVQSSWGAMIDQEEAVGYLVCDALGVELLPGEARAVGKKATEKLKPAKAADKKHTDAARGKRYKARKSAGEKPELAAKLPARLAEINGACRAGRSKVWGAAVNLALPRGKLAAGPPRAVPQPKQEKLPEDSDEVKACEARLAEAEAQLATLEDVEIQAEHAAMAAVRQGRAWPRYFMGPTVTQTNLLRWSLEPGLDRKERRRREAECVKVRGPACAARPPYVSLSRTRGITSPPAAHAAACVAAAAAGDRA